MERNRARLTLYILALYVCFAAISLVACDARNEVTRSSNVKLKREINNSKRLETRKGHSFFEPILKQFVMPLDASNSNSGPYISSPNSMPPYDSLAPIPLPDSPPYCLNPPATPLPPSTIPSPIGGYTPQPPSTIPSPTGGYTPLPPPAYSGPTLPGPSPPQGEIPNPPTTIPSPPSGIPNPPDYYVPTPTQPGFSPPYFTPSPPVTTPSPSGGYVPSPSGGYVPSPHVFLPPVVYPPPTVPPPPHAASTTTLWCVAKPSVPEPIIQEAMNYACGSGADCNQILPSGSCFEPNTVLAHASYAFNSYWQRTKATGGSCEFGGTAMLVTVDPSYDGCHFIYF